MTIVHVDGIAFSEVPGGGISRMWLNVLNRLPRHGCHVKLYLPCNTDKSIPFSSDIELCKYPRERSFRPGRLFRPLMSRIYANSVARIWAGASSGVFQSTHFTTYPSLRIPQVVTVHDLFHECMPDCFPVHQRGPFCERRRQCVNAADAVVAVSRYTMNEVESVYGLNGRPGVVIRNAVDEGFLMPAEKRTDTDAGVQLMRFSPYLLYVGTRYPYKNFGGLLAGFASWEKREEFQLLVVGSPSDHHESALLRAFDIQDRVQFIGHLNDDALRAAYQNASMFVVPSLSEGFGIPIWEAMACGTPVVAARAGAIPEVGGDIAIYFDFGSPQQLAKAFDEALQVRFDTVRLRRGEEMANSFTWDDAAAAYAVLYRALE